MSAPPYGFDITRTQDTRMGSPQNPMQNYQQRAGQFGDLSQYVITPDFAVWPDPIPEYPPEQYTQINSHIIPNQIHVARTRDTDSPEAHLKRIPTYETAQPANEYQVTRVNNTKKPKLQVGKIHLGENKPTISTVSENEPSETKNVKTDHILTTHQEKSVTFPKSKDLRLETNQQPTYSQSVPSKSHPESEKSKPHVIAQRPTQTHPQQVKNDHPQTPNSGMPYQVERMHPTQKLVTQKIVVDHPKEEPTPKKVDPAPPKPIQRVTEAPHPFHLNTTLVVKKIKPITDDTDEENTIKQPENISLIPIVQNEITQPQTRPSSLESVPQKHIVQQPQQIPPRPQTTPATEPKKKSKKKAEKKKGIALLNELQSRAAQQSKQPVQQQQQQQQNLPKRIPRGMHKSTVVSNVGMESKFFSQQHIPSDDEESFVRVAQPRIFSNIGMEEKQPLPEIKQPPINTTVMDLPTGSPVSARRTLSDPPKSAPPKPESAVPPLPPSLVSPPINRRLITPIVEDELKTHNVSPTHPAKVVMPPTVQPPAVSPPSSPPKEEKPKENEKEKEKEKEVEVKPRSFITAPSNAFVVSPQQKEESKPSEPPKPMKTVEVPQAKKPKVFNLPTAADAMRQKNNASPQVPLPKPKEPEKKYEEPLGISDLDGNSGFDLLAAASMNLSAEQLVPQKFGPKLISGPKVDVVKPKKHAAVEMILPRSSSVGDVASLDAPEKKEMDEKELRKATMEAESGLKVQLNPNPPPIKEPSIPVEIKVEKIQNSNLRYVTKPKPKPKPKPMKTITLGSNGIKVEEIPVAEESEPTPPPQKIEKENINIKTNNSVQQQQQQQSVSKDISTPTSKQSPTKDQQAATVPIEEEVPKPAIDDSLDEIPFIPEVENEPKPIIEYPTLEMPKVDMTVFFNSPEIDINMTKKRKKMPQKCLSSDALDSLLENKHQNEEEEEEQNEKDYESEDAIDAYLENRYSMVPQSIPGLTQRATSFTEYYRYGSEKAPEVKPEITNFQHLFTINPHTPHSRQQAPIFFDLPPLVPDLKDESEKKNSKDNEIQPKWQTMYSEWNQLKPNVPGFIVRYPLSLCDYEDDEDDMMKVEEETVQEPLVPAPAPLVPATPTPAELPIEEVEEEDLLEAPKRFCDNYMIASIVICFVLGAISLVLHLFYK